MNEGAAVATCCTRSTTEGNGKQLPNAGNNPHTNTANTSNSRLMYTLTDSYHIVLPFRKGREILHSTSSLWWGEGWLRQLSSSVFFRLRAFSLLSSFHSAPTVVVVVRHPSPITHHISVVVPKVHPSSSRATIYNNILLSTCPLHTNTTAYTFNMPTSYQ